jgi:hypothetical protein
VLATREDYRNDLKDKLIGLEDSGYGDFEYADSELNTYLELSVARLFPALYRRVAEEALTVEEYGTVGYGKIEPTYPDRVFLVEDAVELEPVFGWEMRPTAIIKIDPVSFEEVNVYYYDAYTFPTDDVTAVTIPDIWLPIVVLGALIEALESRQDTGVRGDPGVGSGQTLHEVPLIDRLSSRYQDLRAELAMSLPVVMV